MAENPKARVLVVSFDSGVLDARARQLRAAGYAVEKVRSVDDALRAIEHSEHLEEQGFELVVEDLDLISKPRKSWEEDSEEEFGTSLELCAELSRRENPPARLLLYWPEQQALVRDAKREGWITDALDCRRTREELVCKVGELIAACRAARRSA